MAFVYILRCSDGSYYTGSTTALDLRLAQHNAGEGAEYTRERRPVELVWHAEFERVAEAFGWEKRIQGWSRAKKQLLIDGRYEELPGWSARARAARNAGGASSR
ncbi:GIY-YIG nuclease family protein [Microbacterium ureisolvens]|uniref:GIY-YIG nuclease family protein n=1 Tax=Microbacterium ureisolvens TaxID=2781186 RepID=UPI00363CC2F0